LSDRQKGDPTPAAIKRMCEEIRKGWSPHETWLRSGGQEGQPIETRQNELPPVYETIRFDQLIGIEE